MLTNLSTLLYVLFMGKRLVSVFLIGATLTSLFACGTTHHFLPANPIPRKEWQLSISWNYDCDRNLKGLMAPHVSCYTGMGRNWNFGFGLQFPLLVSHATFAKYGSDTLGSDWMGYATVNQVMLSGNNNPYFEGGLLRIARARTYSQLYGLGIAYGNGLCNPLSTFLSKDIDETKSSSHYRLMPVLRYQIAGRDLGVSYVHYHGKTVAEFQDLARLVRSTDDTVLVLPAGSVDSLTVLPTQIDSGFFQGRWGLFLSSGDTVILAGQFLEHWICGTGMIFDFFPRGGTFESRGIEGKVVNVTQVGKSHEPKHIAGWIHIDPSELSKRIERKQAIVLTRFGPNIGRFIAGLKSYRLDHSVGISTFAYPPRTTSP